MQMVEEELKIMEKETFNNNKNEEDSSNNNNINNSSKMMMMMYDKVQGVVGGSAVVVFSSKECCMCHVAKRLLISLGVGPTIIELDSDSDSDSDIVALLQQLSGKKPQALLPAIFIGGKFLGGIDSLMAAHININGSLVPLLKQAGALWL